MTFRLVRAMPNSLSLNLAVLITKICIWGQQKCQLLNEQVYAPPENTTMQRPKLLCTPDCHEQPALKHLWATAENCSGFPHHTFPGVFPVCLQLPPEVADSPSLCSKVKTHWWRQARLPDTASIPMGNVTHDHGSIDAGALVRSTRADNMPAQKSWDTQLQNSTNIYTWKSVTEQLGESSANNLFCNSN